MALLLSDYVCAYVHANPELISNLNAYLLALIPVGLIGVTSWPKQAAECWAMRLVVNLASALLDVGFQSSIALDLFRCRLQRISSRSPSSPRRVLNMHGGQSTH
jgi:hypothetical protein